MGRIGRIAWLASTLVPASLAAGARADQGAPVTTSSPAQGEGEGAPYHLELGVRGAGGAIFRDGTSRGGGGAVVYVAYPFAHDRWEGELSLGAIAVHDGEVLGLLEVVVERSFAMDDAWSPRVLFGPVLSLDFSGGTTVSGGIIAGGGVTRWLNSRLGITLDLTFRALFGSDTLTVLNGALGLCGRI